MVKEKTPVVAISQTPAKVDLIEETTNTEKCSAGQILPPSSSTPFCQEKATELADEVLQKAEDFVKTDEVVKDTVLDKESTTGLYHCQLIECRSHNLVLLLFVP